MYGSFKSEVRDYSGYVRAIPARYKKFARMRPL